MVWWLKSNHLSAILFSLSLPFQRQPSKGGEPNSTYLVRRTGKWNHEWNSRGRNPPSPNSIVKGSANATEARQERRLECSSCLNEGPGSRVKQLEALLKLTSQLGSVAGLQVWETSGTPRKVEESTVGLHLSTVGSVALETVSLVHFGSPAQHPGKANCLTGSRRQCCAWQRDCTPSCDFVSPKSSWALLNFTFALACGPLSQSRVGGCV